ncbi:MAG: hypothetical protein ACI35S_08585 [Anaeroplasma sp.]
MEDKKKIKVSLSEIIIFLLIVTIFVMGFYIYKLNKDKYYITIGSSQEIERLNNKINDLKDKNVVLEDSEEIKELNDKIKELENKNESLQISLDYYLEQDDNSYVFVREITNKKISEYIIDEKIIDGAGISYEDVSITLYEDNVCEIYEGYGNGLTGVYRIDDKKLIANMVLATGEEGALCYSDTNVIFEFEIVNDATIKLINIKDNNKLEEGQTSQYIENDVFEKGMTYSIK